MLSQHLAPEVGEGTEPPWVWLGGNWGPPQAHLGTPLRVGAPQGVQIKGRLSFGGPAKLLPPAGPSGWVRREAVTGGNPRLGELECSGMSQYHG